MVVRAIFFRFFFLTVDFRGILSALPNISLRFPTLPPPARFRRRPPRSPRPPGPRRTSNNPFETAVSSSGAIVSPPRLAMTHFSGCPAGVITPSATPYPTSRTTSVCVCVCVRDLALGSRALACLGAQRREAVFRLSLLIIAQGNKQMVTRMLVPRSESAESGFFLFCFFNCASSRGLCTIACNRDVEPASLLAARDPLCFVLFFSYFAHFLKKVVPPRKNKQTAALRAD